MKPSASDSDSASLPSPSKSKAFITALDMDSLQSPSSGRGTGASVLLSLGTEAHSVISARDTGPKTLGKVPKLEREQSDFEKLFKVRQLAYGSLKKAKERKADGKEQFPHLFTTKDPVHESRELEKLVSIVQKEVRMPGSCVTAFADKSAVQKVEKMGENVVREFKRMKGVQSMHEDDAGNANESVEGMDDDALIKSLCIKEVVVVCCSANTIVKKTIAQRLNGLTARIEEALAHHKIESVRDSARLLTLAESLLKDTKLAFSNENLSVVHSLRHRILAETASTEVTAQIERSQTPEMAAQSAKQRKEKASKAKLRRKQAMEAQMQQVSSAMQRSSKASEVREQMLVKQTKSARTSAWIVLSHVGIFANQWVGLLKRHIEEIEYRKKLMIAVQMIQRFVRTYKLRKNRARWIAFLKIVAFMDAHITKWKEAYRRKCTDKVLRFLREVYTDNKVLRSFERYKARVKTCQRHCRDYVIVRKARRVAIAMQYRRFEKKQIQGLAKRKETQTRKLGDDLSRVLNARSTSNATSFTSDIARKSASHQIRESRAVLVETLLPEDLRTLPSVPEEILQDCIEFHMQKRVRQFKNQWEHYLAAKTEYNANSAQRESVNQWFDGLTRAKETKTFQALSKLYMQEPKRPFLRVMLDEEELMDMMVSGLSQAGLPLPTHLTKGFSKGVKFSTASKSSGRSFLGSQSVSDKNTELIFANGQKRRTQQSVMQQRVLRKGLTTLDRKQRAQKQLEEMTKKKQEKRSNSPPVVHRMSRQASSVFSVQQ